MASLKKPKIFKQEDERLGDDDSSDDDDDDLDDEELAPRRRHKASTKHKFGIKSKKHRDKRESKVNGDDDHENEHEHDAGDEEDMKKDMGEDDDDDDHDDADDDGDEGDNNDGDSDEDGNEHDDPKIKAEDDSDASNEPTEKKDGKPKEGGEDSDNEEPDDHDDDQDQDEDAKTMQEGKEDSVAAAVAAAAAAAGEDGADDAKPKRIPKGRKKKRKSVGDDVDGDDPSSPASSSRRRRTSLSRSAKKADTSYKEVMAIPVVYYDAEQPQKGSDGGNGGPAASVAKSPHGNNADRGTATTSGNQRPSSAGRKKRAPRASKDGDYAPPAAAPSKSPKSPGGKKVFFNHSVVQDTIWAALTSLGWTTTKPYKTQRNYHPPPNQGGGRTRVFDSIGRVMDFVRSDPQWRENEKIQAGLAAYEQVTGDVGGSTSFSVKNKGLGTPRLKRKLEGYSFNESSFMDIVWSVLVADHGWKLETNGDKKYFVKPAQDGDNDNAAPSDSAEKEEDGTGKTIDDDGDAKMEDEDKTNTETKEADGGDDGDEEEEDGNKKIAAKSSKAKDGNDDDDSIPKSPFDSGDEKRVDGHMDEEAQSAPRKPFTPKGEAGVDYFETAKDVLFFVKDNTDIRNVDSIKAALEKYLKTVEVVAPKVKQRRVAKSTAEKGTKKTPSGLNKPRPHKFSNPIMQDTIWKALAEAGWTTARRKNSSQRNYFPPKGCGSRRAVYQTITAVLDYVRTSMEWMLNEKVQLALKEYDRLLAASLENKANEVGGTRTPVKSRLVPDHNLMNANGGGSGNDKKSGASARTKAAGKAELKQAPHRDEPSRLVQPPPPQMHAQPQSLHQQHPDHHQLQQQQQQQMQMQMHEEEQRRMQQQQHLQQQQQQQQQQQHQEKQRQHQMQLQHQHQQHQQHAQQQQQHAQQQHQHQQHQQQLEEQHHQQQMAVAAAQARMNSERAGMPNNGVQLGLGGHIIGNPAMMNAAMNHQGLALGQGMIHGIHHPHGNGNPAFAMNNLGMNNLGNANLGLNMNAMNTMNMNAMNMNTMNVNMNMGMMRHGGLQGTALDNMGMMAAMHHGNIGNPMQQHQQMQPQQNMHGLTVMKMDMGQPQLMGIQGFDPPHPNLPTGQPGTQMQPSGTLMMASNPDPTGAGNGNNNNANGATNNPNNSNNNGNGNDNSSSSPLQVGQSVLI
eukprot:CAMPEP_0119546668 /NCGR_PEP_ID=MMETSP1352-20130426/986_1 /TAXON_ID=265584 /ORGANISM="Stauroneis constricta, Strain CCMP1120" /LENGTH=1177 /DNA_ID=CAMNT_0007591389 /DNA_START=342 /DNA_END=3875 /DNA_ORIENTATION=-